MEALAGSVPSTSVQTLSETASSLPATYAHGDIGDAGTVGLAGSASYSSGVYTLGGAGADIWNTADGFQFACTTMTGNGTYVAEVASMTNFASYGKAGIMMRSSLDPSSAYADVFLDQTKTADFEYRSSYGGSAASNYSSGSFSTLWVKLVCSGSTFTAYYSSNGTSWTSMGSETISMGNTIFVGLITSSHSSSTLATATFSNVSATGTVAQPPTVATPAAASPSPVTGTTTNLSVLGADGLGAADLTYTWAATTLPAGAAPPTFSANGTTAAASTTATFTRAGTYGFTVTIVDEAGLSTTSTVNVTVNQTATSLAVSPVSTTVPAAGQVQCTATADDQFGNAMANPVALLGARQRGDGRFLRPVFRPVYGRDCDRASRDRFAHRVGCGHGDVRPASLPPMPTSARPAPPVRRVTRRAATPTRSAAAERTSRAPATSSISSIRRSTATRR